MQVHTTIAAFRGALEGARHRGARVGLVPTMGFLHEGHRTLLDTAVAHDDVAALTIFVNPLQFAPTEDLATYPPEISNAIWPWRMRQGSPTSCIRA